MRRLALTMAVLAAATALAGCGGTEATSFAPTRAAPALKIGMTLAEARAAFGSRFETSDSGHSSCASFTFGDGVGGLAAHGRIEVVSLSAPYDSDGELSGPGPATDRGLRPGDGLRRAIALYGRPDVAAPEEYGGVDLLWRLDVVDGHRLWLRITQRDGPDYIQIGIAPAVYNVEGCA